MGKKEISQIEQEEGIGEEVDPDKIKVEESDEEAFTGFAVDEEVK